MTKLKENKRRLIPRYAVLPLLSVLVMNFVTYYLTSCLTAARSHVQMALPLDARVPFVPAFIVVYILAYGQWGIGYVLIARESEAVGSRILSGEILAKAICLVLFLAVPTTMVRPEVSGRDAFSWLTRLIYRADAPVNLFPSLHCLASWVCLRGAWQLKRIGPWYRWVSLVFTLLVCCSVVLVKQHVLLDIPAGVLAAEAGQYLAKKWRTGRFFEFLNRRTARPTAGGTA